MKNAAKLINLVGQPKIISQPVTFPLSEQTLKEIEALKYSFRQSFEDHKVYSLGLSAPQIGVNKRFFIMPTNFGYASISNFKLLKNIVRKFDVFINPTILSSSEKIKIDREYCLSVGFNQYKVQRPAFVEVQYYTPDGTLKTDKLDELKSRVFQHEYDHLEGIIISEIGTPIPTASEKRLLRRSSRRREELQ